MSERYGVAVKTLLKQVVPIVIVAYAIVALAVYAVPHLPLADTRTFHALLRAQMTVDHSRELGKKQMILLLGSSVVERGVQERYMDTLLAAGGHPEFELSNSGTGGFFAKANLPMFRAMLERGLRPSKVIYGYFLQELNEKSIVQNNILDEDTSSIKLKEKNLWNVMLYGARALHPLTRGEGLHVYLFAVKNAFREVHDPTALDRLMFGQNMFGRDSTYQMSESYYRSLEEIVQLCRERKIPFAFYNAPVRPYIEDPADLPYHRRKDSYAALFRLAQAYHLPVWNFDQPGFFPDEEFLDTYHLKPLGARRITKMLAERILAWHNGVIQQDSSSTLLGN